MELDVVIKGIYSYGWYPALHLLSKLEKKQQFEDCAIIKQALDGLLVGREFEMTTKTDEISLDECFEKVIKNSNNQDVLIDNMPDYIKNFEKMVMK